MSSTKSLTSEGIFVVLSIITCFVMGCEQPVVLSEETKPSIEQADHSPEQTKYSIEKTKYPSIKSIEETLTRHLQNSKTEPKMGKRDSISLMLSSCVAYDWIANAGPFYWNYALLDGKHPLTALVSYSCLSRQHPKYRGLYGLKLVSHSLQPAFSLNGLVLIELKDKTNWNIKASDLNKVLLSKMPQPDGVAIATRLVPRSLLAKWFVEKHYINATPTVIATALETLLTTSKGSIGWKVAEEFGMPRKDIQSILEGLSVVPGLPRAVAASYYKSDHKDFYHLLVNVISDKMLQVGIRYAVVGIQIEYINSHAKLFRNVNNDVKKMITRVNQINKDKSVKH